MANCVKIKMNEKVMMLRSSTLTVGNLAMIFKLGMNQGIYICGEEEGEIIAPTETAFFNIEDPRSQGPLPHYLRHVIRFESPCLTRELSSPQGGCSLARQGDSKRITWRR